MKNSITSLSMCWSLLVHEYTRRLRAFPLQAEWNWVKFRSSNKPLTYRKTAWRRRLRQAHTWALFLSSWAETKQEIYHTHLKILLHLPLPPAATTFVNQCSYTYKAISEPTDATTGIPDVQQSKMRDQLSGGPRIVMETSPPPQNVEY